MSSNRSSSSRINNLYLNFKSLGYPLILLLCSTFIWSANVSAAEKAIAVITSKTIGEKVSETERQRYLEALKSFAQEAITQFLEGLHLKSEQIAEVIEAVDVESLNGNCLDQATLFAIYLAVKGANCTTVTDLDLNYISAIILPNFDVAVTKVTTNFYPYGVNSLRLTQLPSNKVLIFVEQYPLAGERENFDTLIVLAFLNLYWEHVNDKSTLSDTELSILYSGFAQSGIKLHNLCSTFDRTQQPRCENMAQEARQLSLRARAKQSR
jgi:hypothetical protein